MRALALSFALLIVSASFGQQPKEITNSIGMKLVLIPAGTFTMGSPFEVADIDNVYNQTQHKVTISKSYYLGMYEVSQGEYEKVIRKNPSKFQGAQNPVEMVSWDNAVSFCKKLSDMAEERAAGREYRLPTEAEWEYACRAGSTTRFSSGDTKESLLENAWFGEVEILNGKTYPVGEKKPNRWGLYDMHGNVSEWCKDWYGDYPLEPTTDPMGPEGQFLEKHKVYRGGCCTCLATYCRSGYRDGIDRSDSAYSIGFRVSLSPSVEKPEVEHEKEQ